LLPALCASSPILGGQSTAHLDGRLTYYKTNQANIPSITGQVIPEPIFSKAEYEEQIFDTIKKDISPYDPGDILDPVWVNSRGAITRFDRGSIEIRIMDVQECPLADLAIVTLVNETLKEFTKEHFLSFKEQTKWETASLAALLDKSIKDGPQAVFDNAAYLKIFGINNSSASVQEIWLTIVAYLKKSGNHNLERWMAELNVILTQGTLSQRILKSLDGDFSPEAIVEVYKKLALCLAEDKVFIP